MIDIIQKLIIECCGGCAVDDVEAQVVTPVLDMMSVGITNLGQENGRMFDYGSTKSDSKEGRMSRAKLFRMGKMAQSLHDRMQDNDDLPEWVQDKITTAEDRLKAAYDYLDYKIHRMKTDGHVVTEATIRREARKILRG
jgi:hypothetical protein